MILEYIIYIFLFIGVFFNLLGCVGILRFPDVYTRLHAGTKCTTFGSIFILGSVILYGLVKWILNGSANDSVLAIHTIVALILILVTNPTGAHAIAQAAHKSGVLPVKAVTDDLKGKPSSKPNVEKEVKK